jgi:hypothetical protein
MPGLDLPRPCGHATATQWVSTVPNIKIRYHELEIAATSPGTEIWLGDDAGFFVQKDVGTLTTSLMPGKYLVEFGLGAPPYPIHLDKSRRFTQAELEMGPACVRPVPIIG